MSENLTRDLPPDGVELILTQLRLMDGRITRLDERITTLDERITTLDGRMSALEEKVDRRLGETRPIWESVLIRLDAIDARQNAFEEKLNEFDGKLNAFGDKLNEFEGKLNAFDQKLIVMDEKIEKLGIDMRAGFRRLDRHMGTLARDVIAVRSDQLDLESRMERIEGVPQEKTTPSPPG